MRSVPFGSSSQPLSSLFAVAKALSIKFLGHEVDNKDGCWLTRTRMMEGVMWVHWCKRWLDLCLWWLPKTEQESRAETTPSPKITEDAPTRVATVEGDVAKDLDEGDADDLTVIKGIGPAIQTKLRGFGITHFADLAESDPEDLAGKLKAWQPISATRVKSWIEAARDRSASRT